MILYKNWRLRSKILFAAVVPFVLAAVLTLPVSINLFIKNTGDEAKSKIEALAYSTALQIRAEIENVNNQAALLVQVIESIRHANSISREELNNILKGFIEKNEMVAGVWTIWEKDAFDGKDAQYANAAGYDETGRFFPFWTKNYGVLELRPLRYYNDANKSKIYQLTKTSLHEVMLDPYPYRIGDREVSIATISYPILNNGGAFIGIIGADIDMGYFQKAVDNLKAHGISAGGLLADDNQYLINMDKSLVGKANVDSINWKTVRKFIENGDIYLKDELDENIRKHTFKAIAPINFSSFNKSWLLSMTMPMAEIKGEVYVKFIFLIVVACVCFLIGVAVSLVTARNIASPITVITNALKSISNGDYKVDVPYVDSEDEIGEMAESAIIFRENARELMLAKQQAEEANKAKTDFLANMSHELRTPIHAMLSYSKLGLEKITDKNEKLYKYFHNIYTSGDRLLKLLNNLLDLSKLEAGKVEFIFVSGDISNCIEQVKEELNSLLNDKQITFEVKQNDSDTTLIMDYEKIIQVLINVISNAIKFSPVGSKITLNISGSTVQYSEKPYPALMVEVKDEGVGIPPEELKVIFDKFVQSSKTNKGSGGTGLGLSIAASIVKAHKGSIWAENSNEKGAIIKFVLPCDPTSIIDEIYNPGEPI